MVEHWTAPSTQRKLTSLRRAARADAVAVFAPILTGDTCLAAFRTGLGDERLVGALRQIHDAPLPFTQGGAEAGVGPQSLNLPPIWVLRLQPNSFVEIKASWTSSGFPHPGLHAPEPLAPTLWSACVNASGHLVALVVLARWEDSKPFSARSRRNANETLGRLDFLAPPPRQRPSHLRLLCDPRGDVVAASLKAGSHLGPDEMTAIKRQVIAYSRRPGTHEPTVVSTLAGRLEFEHLNGGKVDRVLVSVACPRYFRARPVMHLTARQREIAAYAASEATTSQIGEALDLSVNTIKHHLKSIYNRLQVRDRGDLRALLLS